MIRAATVADAPAIAALQTRAWWRAYPDIVDPALLAADPEDERVGRWARHLAAQESQTLVADVGGHIAGFASVGPSRLPDPPPGEGELFAIYVDPAAQGAGLGTALLAAAERVLRDLGYTSGVLEVLAANEPARAFYSGHGWPHDGGVPVAHDWGPCVHHRRAL